METLSYFEAIILGLVQGLGEFLPISSSGHLALMQKFFGIQGDKVLVFTVLLHLGTLISVFIIYAKDILELLKELIMVFKDILTGQGLQIDKNPIRKMGFLILVATVPTAIIGIGFEDIFQSFYGSILAIGLGLIFTGAILMLAEKMGNGHKEADKMLFRSAIFIGIMQGIAITPGVSRSGSTLFGGLITGLDRTFAVKFAFLISIPSILGSFVLEAPKAFSVGLGGANLMPVIVGMIVAFLSGLFAIKIMIKLVSKQKLVYFSWYTWSLGGICIILFLLQSINLIK